MDHKPLPIGIDNFETIIQEDYYYVDKTPFIKELIDFKGGSNLFTRPRRFGKTLTLSMFQYFFEKTDKDNSYLFDSLAIKKAGDKYLSHMGKYPVINITLKSAKQLNYADSLEKIKEELSAEFTKDMNHLWNFLFFTGYLKKVSVELVGQERLVTMAIPNEEVLYIYKNKILDWFDESIRAKDLSTMYEAVMNGDALIFQKELSNLLAETISFNDEREYFYHGFLLGTLGLMKNYIVKSNRESGDGRTDIFIKHPQIDRTAVILELKVADKANQLPAKCKEALKQIEDKRYDFDLKQEGYESIMKYGIAFYRKNCRIEVVS